MQWGEKQRPPHTLLFTLSKHRPRWMIELAKVAAASASRRGRSRIARDDIFDQLHTFGQHRIEDKFRSQCPELHELVAAFNRGIEDMSTAQLLSVIDNKILNHLTPSIVGVSGKPTNLNVAALLFEVGLFYGRREHSDGTYDHVTFTDRPTLLRARTSIDDGLKWEIHPVFRQALEIRDSSGRPSRKEQRTRRL